MCWNGCKPRKEERKDDWLKTRGCSVWRKVEAVDLWRIRILCFCITCISRLTKMYLHVSYQWYISGKTEGVLHLPIVDLHELCCDLFSHKTWWQMDPSYPNPDPTPICSTKHKSKTSSKKSQYRIAIFTEFQYTSYWHSKIIVISYHEVPAKD